jgi:3'-phosphoadenosine 5'-phosphosulfate sulfotransferase (PAPS reductase)/FAD synthetase
MSTTNPFSDIQNKAEPVIGWLMSLLAEGHPLACGCSFGKDSSVVLVLMLEAVKRSINAGVNVPQCYVTHSDTLIENPAMSFYSQVMLDELEFYCQNNAIPVQVIRVTPALASTFAYATIGRGKLPRFVNSEYRECSVDWKIRPQAKAIKRVVDQSAMVTARSVVSLHGSRYSESTSRSTRMTKRGDANTSLIPQDNGTLSNAPISDWEMEDVWCLLMACGTDRGRLYDTFVEDFNWCLKLYKDANEGTCAIITGDGGNKAACGSRFGCAWCTPASRTGDKSMEALIASDPEYDYLRGVNRFSNLLVNTQYDLSKRDWLGRKLSKAGYVRFRPDNYSPSFRRNLLRYLITLDVQEEERGEDHAAALHCGDVADTAENRRLASPQFQFITPQLIVAIDFMWSMQRDFDYAFPALREWYEIRELGRRYQVPDSELMPPVSIPEARWFHVGTFDHPWMIDGLRDPLGEAVNLKRKPGTLPYMTCSDLGGSGQIRRVVAHETAEELTIDREEAGIFVTCEFEDLFFDTLNMDAKSSLIYLLDRGLVKLGAGMASKYDFVARRAHYYTRLKDELNVADLEPVLYERSISDAEHSRLIEVAIAKQEEQNHQQPDFFQVA